MADNRESQSEVIGLLGVGLDNKDEHKRLTTCDDFLLVGGSPETHESMQELAIRFAEALRKRGKRLPQTPLEEVIELLHDANRKCGQ